MTGIPSTLPIDNPAEIVREYGPFPGVDRVNGVSFDGEHVWVAAEDKLAALDPESGQIVRTVDVPEGETSLANLWRIALTICAAALHAFSLGGSAACSV